ncbi:MAG: hypothetical protein RLN60_03840 [Phycisphaerales bacterium]
MKTKNRSLVDVFDCRTTKLGAMVFGLAIGSLPPSTAMSQTQPAPTPSVALPTQPVEDALTGGGDDAPPPIVYNDVSVSRYLTVDVVAQNAPVVDVLRKIAIQSRKNIVTSAGAARDVNATIYGASFYDALDALLHSNGLGYVERNDFIYVYTSDELATIERSTRRPVSRIVHLDYLRASDARTIASHLLSAEGHIETIEDLAVESASSGEDSFSSLSSAVEGIYTPDTDEHALMNSLVIIDYEEHADEVEEMLIRLDTRPAQILIESTILQTTLNEQNAFGVDFAVLGDVQFTDFFNFPSNFNPIDFESDVPDTDNPPSARNENFAVSNPGNTGQGAATARGGIIIGDDIGIFIRALDQVSDVTLLSNPKVMALNRQRAKVLVGTRVGFLETTVVENQVLQTVQFIDTGIEIDVRPYLMRDDKIRMELAPKVSSVVFRLVETQGGITQQIPDENIQTVATDVLVPQGHTAVIGGLFREDTSRSRSQVPVLGDIPIVGAAFRGHDDEIDQVELIFLIKPTVLEDRIVSEMGERTDELVEDVRVGSRLGLLPWSRERQTSQLNLEAERLLAQGKRDRALWVIRRSLELHAQQPEAVRIRERLVDDPLWWPTRSVLERTIREMAGGDEFMLIEEEAPGEPDGEAGE